MPVNKQGIVLAAFAVLVTSALAFTHYVTRDRITTNQIKHRQSTLAEVLPSRWHDHSLEDFKLDLLDQRSNTIRTCYIAKLNGEPMAAIITAVAPDGYSGDINLLIGILADGTVTGVRVTSHSETPGLGDAIELRRSNWIQSFNGKSLTTPIESRWTVKKQNGDFDQFTGATITPRAVVIEVANTLKFFNEVKDQLFES